MKDKLLLIDTETGGLDPSRHCILSMAALVLNYDGTVIDQMYTLIDEKKRVAPVGALAFYSWREIEDQALAVNGLTRERIQAEGVNTLMATEMLLDMLTMHDMRSGVTIVAHNARFDTDFLRSLFSLAGVGPEYDKRFSHRTICTQAVALFMEQAGMLRLESSSLDGLCKRFGVNLDREGGHNALNDALATAEVFQHLMRRCREGL